MGMRRRQRRRRMVAVGAVAHHQGVKRSEEEAAAAAAAEPTAVDDGLAPVPEETYAPPGPDPADELEHLGQLHSSGVLTDEEFGAAKAKALGL